MKTLNDKIYRQCKVEDLTEEELGIRNLMVGLENYRKSSSETSSIRISAILLAAAMIAGLIFLVFPVKEMFSSKTALTSYAPASTVVRSYPSTTDGSNENLNPAEEMERQDSLFLAATKDIVVPQAKEKVRKEPKALHHIKSKKIPVQKENKSTASEEEKEEESLNNDFNHYFEVASLALPSADQLKIDKQGDHIIITTIDVEGNASDTDGSHVIESHRIKTTTPPAATSKAEPHYIIEGKKGEITKEELNKNSPSQIAAINVLKAGSKAISERSLKDDGRGYVIIKLKE